MLDLVKEIQSGSRQETLPANFVHHSCDASRCESNNVIAHISGGSALDLP